MAHSQGSPAQTSLPDDVTIDNPFRKHGKLRVAKSGTYLEHADGTPFFFLADTCWTGPALSTLEDWQIYLQDRRDKGFTAIQFNIVSPWRTAPTDRDGNLAYQIRDGVLSLNEAFYQRLDGHFHAINQRGMLAVPVLCWAHKKGDAGKELTAEQITTLIQLQVQRYAHADVLWILAGDNQYDTDAGMWKQIGQTVFGDQPQWPVTTHPTGENFPWDAWEDQRWLTVLGYQSGHGDSDQALRWLTQGPPSRYGQRQTFTRPVINLEPPYEDHRGYTTRQPHTALSVRRAMYWSLLVHPTAGVTYGGHGVWSWHTQPGKEPTDHAGTGIAKIWREALALPGACQMIHLRSIFASLSWPELRPAQALLRDQPGEKKPAEFIACAATPDRTQVMVYMPQGGTLALVPELNHHHMEWINPRDGEYHPGDAENLIAPDDGDWILLARK